MGFPGKIKKLTNTTEPAKLDKLQSESSFADLGVLAEIADSLAESGITNPFPIQEFTIPLALTGVDLIGQARTGTGKTLAFGIAALQRIKLAGDEDFAELENPGTPQALIVAPTRELAVQIGTELANATKIRKAKVATIYGGVDYEPQIKALTEGADIVVGTPGRLLDLVDRKNLDLTNLSVMVLDEADEMLDLGFLPDIERLVSLTPTTRQTMLFSATMPAEIISLARANMNQPVNVRAEGSATQITVPDTAQFIYQAHDLDKPEIVGRILQADSVDKTMVFCKTKRAADRLSSDLEDRGFKSAAIHGDLHQKSRERALRKFRDGKIQVLVATDVAARGIDVTGVSHVINYECPEDAKTYVHRIGRTGRAGAKGVAVTLVDWSDVVRWKVINKTLELGFDEPVETYSTSPHLFSDLNIAEGTKGFISSYDPLSLPKSSSSSSGGRSGKRSADKPKRDSANRKQNRTRRCTRNGQPVVGENTTAKAKKTRRRTRNGKPVENN